METETQKQAETTFAVEVMHEHGVTRFELKQATDKKSALAGFEKCIERLQWFGWSVIAQRQDKSLAMVRTPRGETAMVRLVEAKKKTVRATGPTLSVFVGQLIPFEESA